MGRVRAGAVECLGLSALATSPLVLVGIDRDLVDLLLSMPGCHLLGVIDTDPEADTLGAPYLGDDRNWTMLRAKHAGLKALLAVDRPAERERLVIAYGPANLATLVAPDAYVSNQSRFGPGCIVQRGARVLPGVVVGTAVKLHVGATVHHDSRVGSCCTIAPGARLLGSVTLADRVYVGAHAVILPTRSVGAGAVIGAGAVVTSDE
jgi:sugar O-acyltransferase (sialic acid O-acetyltransferase NeuD family)